MTIKNYKKFRNIKNKVLINYFTLNKLHDILVLFKRIGIKL